MSEEYIYEQADNFSSKRNSPSFQRNMRKSLIPKEKNFNHYLINLTSKLNTSTSILDKIKFHLSYIYNNRSLANSLLKKKC